MAATPPPPARRERGPNPVSEFFAGVGTLGRGFAFWRRRPGVMALGLVPAAIVAAIVLTAVIVLGVFLEPITGALTFFADGWEPGWRRLLRLLLAIALVVATLALAARTFTALTLLVGAPFYDRIHEAAEESAGGADGTPPLSLGASLRATVVIVLQSLGASVVVLLLGLVPVVGSVLAPVAGVLLTASALTRELTLAPLGRRGFDRRGRARLRRARGARSFGFGLAVQACYLVPFGAVITMPAAVAGATLLSRDLLGGAPAAGPTPPLTSSAG